MIVHDYYVHLYHDYDFDNYHDHYLDIMIRTKKQDDLFLTFEFTSGEYFELEVETEDLIDRMFDYIQECFMWKRDICDLNRFLKEKKP